MRSDGTLKVPLAWTLFALFVAYIPQLWHKPIWISALLGLCMSLRWWAERSRGVLVSAWVRTPIGIACFLAVLQHYDGLNGVAPGSALLAVMAALKILETRSRRDHFVLLFIALFLVLAGFLTEQYLWSAPYLLVSVSVIVTAWLAVGRRGPDRSAGWYMRHMRRHMLLSLPVLLAMWVLFPRVPGPFWAIPTQAGDNYTGLSNKMSPGDISRLSESQEKAFRVRFDGLQPDRDQLYWRAIVMPTFDGRSWVADDPVFSRVRDESVAARGQEARYTVTMEATNQRWLFALDMPGDWSGKGIYRTRQQTLERRRQVDERIAYTVRSFLDYSADPELSARARSRYTRLPTEGNARSRSFAAEMWAQNPDPARYAQALLDFYTNEPFYYTLTPPALGRSAVDEFLFDSRRGFCEHYASSFAFLMRAAGIPARVVAGYQGGETNLLGDFLTVRQSDAHAWTEVWLSGRGWVRIDPTAAVAPQRIEQNLDSALREFGERRAGRFDLPIVERLKVAWDMIDARWNEWVLGYGPDSQRALLEALGVSDADWRDLTIMLAVVLIGIMAMVTIYLWVKHQPPRPDALLRLFHRAQRRLGVPALRGETPSSWAERVARLYPEDGSTARRFANDFLKARYADNRAAATRLPLSLRRIRWRAARQLSLARRRHVDARKQRKSTNEERQ